MKNLLIIAAFLFISHKSNSQSFPWERPLKIAYSQDGQFFNVSGIFQDSSGVPSMINWKGDTMACVFQWFRQPMNSITWDKVAVKFSYDGGMNWTQPLPIVVNGIPSNFQRPFDPTLVVISADSLRIYYSSSEGMPGPGGDSIIDSYSAVSVDGINYTFEPGARFSHPVKKVIDPAVIIYQGSWHYSAPIGPPQDGAYHCLSSEGISFTQQADYPSDFQHNWTGNYMINDTNELRFYGHGQMIWYNTSVDGFGWTGYVNTNITGGDPTVMKNASNSYVMVYTGDTYTSVEEIRHHFSVYPNPVSDNLNFANETNAPCRFEIYSSNGNLVNSGSTIKSISVAGFPGGKYMLLLQFPGYSKAIHFIKP